MDRVMDIRLDAFLLNGECGPLRLGATESEVRAALGEPEAIAPAKRNRPEIRKWGNVELHIFQYALILIVFKYGQFQWTSPRVRYVGWFVPPAQPFSLDEFLAHCRGAGLECTSSRVDLGPTQTDLVTPGDVVVTFAEGFLQAMCLKEGDGERCRRGYEPGVKHKRGDAPE
jgi:hypothetical protein